MQDWCKFILINWLSCLFSISSWRALIGNSLAYMETWCSCSSCCVYNFQTSCSPLPNVYWRKCKNTWQKIIVLQLILLVLFDHWLSCVVLVFICSCNKLNYTLGHFDCFFLMIFNLEDRHVDNVTIVCFQKISIPPSRREFHIGPPTPSDFPFWGSSGSPPTPLEFPKNFLPPPIPPGNIFFSRSKQQTRGTCDFVACIFERWRTRAR